MKKNLKSALFVTVLGVILVIFYAFGASALLSKDEIKQNILQSNIEMMSYGEEYIDLDYLAQPYTDESYAELNAKAVEITASCETDYDKAYAINKWVADNVCYDYDYYYHGNPRPNDDAPGVFETGIAVCEGYARLMNAMCRAAGVPSRVVHGTSFSSLDTLETLNEKYEEREVDHAWLEVYVNGAWNLCDPTWDSSNRYEYGEKTIGTSGDHYFTCSTESFSSRHYNTYYFGDIKFQDFIFVFRKDRQEIKKYVGEGGVIVFPNLEVTGAYTDVFSDCYDKITEAVLPEKMKNVPSYLFRGCSKLEKVTLAQNTETLGSNCFNGCLNLKEISIPNSVSKIGAYCFSNCKTLNSVEFPEGISRLENYCFSGCENLETVVIPSSVKEIGASCFYNCKALQSISLPDGLEKIEYQAFAYCSALQSIEIPENVDSLRTSCFVSCKQLKNIKLGSKITEIPSGCFSDCPELTTITGGENITKVGDSAFSFCGKYTGNSFLENLEYLGKKAFRNCYELSSKVKVPIAGNDGEFSFEGCQKLEEVVLEDGLKKIPYSAFRNCSSLKTIEIPESVEEIGSFAFSGCALLEDITLGENIKAIGTYSFNGCAELKEINISSAVTEIPDGAFYGCGELVTVSGGENVTKVGNRAFFNCAKFTGNDFLMNMVYMGPYAFNGCNEITKIKIPVEGHENDYSFSYSDKLEEVIFEEGITEVPRRVFIGCSALKKVKLPSTATKIGYCAFRECSALESVTLPEKLETLEEQAFYDCDLIKEVKLPSNVTTIGEWCFANSGGIETVYMPITVTSIAYNAFIGANAIKTVYYGGTQSDWERIEIADGNRPLTRAKIIFSDHVHTFSVTVTKEATCLEQGEQTRTCTDCGYSFTEKTPLGAHKEIIVPGIASSCTRTGLTDGKKCSVCGITLVEQQVTERIDHTYSVTVTKESTCLEQGEQKKTCQNCGYSFTEKTPFGAHKEIIVPGIASSCTKTGLTDGKKCSVCGITLVEQQVTEKIDHTYSVTVTKEATCLEQGEQKKSCQNCGYSFTEKTPFGAHKEIIVPGIASSCTKTGLTEGKKCSVCGTVTVPQKETAKTAHTFVLFAVKDPTCSEEGEVTYRCSVCSATKTEAIAKLNHVDADGDHICDNCSAELPKEKCTCICHKSGFSGFIYKIIRIFWKIFKIKRECSCGALHY